MLLPIKDMPGYFIHSDGYVLSTRGRHGAWRPAKVKAPSMLTSATGSAYPGVVMYRGVRKPFSQRVHRLVAEAFCKNPDGKRWVHHKNGDKNDARAANLEWVTPGENRLYYTRRGI